MPISSNDDDHLIIRFSHGDPEAIERLYQHYRPALLERIALLTSNPGRTEAILQETYQRIWRSAHQYEATKSSLSSWMLAIVDTTAEAYLDS